MKSRKNKKMTGLTINDVLNHFMTGVNDIFDKELIKVKIASAITCCMYLIAIWSRNWQLLLFAISGSIVFHLTLKQLIQDAVENNKAQRDSAAVILSLAKRAQKAGDKEIHIQEWEEDGQEHYVIDLGEDVQGINSNGWKVHPNHFKEGGIYHNGKN